MSRQLRCKLCNTVLRQHEQPERICDNCLRQHAARPAASTREEDE